MKPEKLVVLKFGSSIFSDAASYPMAAAEITRYASRGYAVVAVVSALAGETDRLFHVIRCVSQSPDEYLLANYVSTGEKQSAYLLAIAVSELRGDVQVVDPAHIRLLAAGAVHDANPVSVDSRQVWQLLSEYTVLIIPGFFGVDEQGRTVLFGRGGSDDSALFLAHHLKATCILVKDLDGIFERDPALPGPMPRRYKSINYDDALQCARVMVQPKAVMFARAHEMSFLVRRVGSDLGTTVGPVSSEFFQEDSSAKQV